MAARLKCVCAVRASRTGRPRSDAELAEAVQSPAVRSLVRRNCTCVLCAGADRGEGIATLYLLRDRGAWNAHAGRDTGMRWRASKLTIYIRTPAPAGAVGADTASVRSACAEPHEYLSPGHRV